MCIRDRGGGGVSLESSGDGAEADLFVLRVHGLIMMEWCRCLLYTSDATDERSSVDLGGRRIIKKKKTEYRASCSKKNITYGYELLIG